jgi:hypothetical protein
MRHSISYVCTSNYDDRERTRDLHVGSSTRPASKKRLMSCCSQGQVHKATDNAHYEDLND